MTVGEIVAVIFLVVLVVLILNGIRGHHRSGNTQETRDGIGNPETDGHSD